MENKIYLCSNDNFHKLNPFSIAPINVSNIEYPSVMVYIYTNLLCFNKEKSQMYDFTYHNQSIHKLIRKYEKLFQKCNKKIQFESLILAYKMKISQDLKCQEELENYSKSDISDINPKLVKIIQEIITNIKEEIKQNKEINMINDSYNTKCDQIFEIYKVHFALNNLMLNGYDIKEFIGKLPNEIVDSVFKDSIKDITPLYPKKIQLFKNYYNKITHDLKDDIIKQYELVPNNFYYINDELSHPGTLIQLLRKRNIVPSPVGEEKRDDFNSRVKNKVFKIIVNEVKKKYHEKDPYIDKELQDKIYDYYKDEKLQIDPSIKLFIEELENQYVDEDEIDELKNFDKDSHIMEEEEEAEEEVPTSINEFQTESYDDIKQEIQDLIKNPIFKALNESDNEEGYIQNDETRVTLCLSPYHLSLFIIDNKHYLSVLHYLIVVKMSWYSNLSINQCYKNLFKNPKKVYTSNNKLNLAYVRDPKHFLDFNSLKSKLVQLFEERKVNLAKEANYSKFVSNSADINIQELLVSSDPNKLVFDLNSDNILGSGILGNGFNVIGKNMENLRQYLIENMKLIRKKKTKLIEKIYIYGSNKYINNWLELKLKDLIRTVIIFAKYFSINTITGDLTSYIIENVYLPCKNIYISCSKQFIKHYPEHFNHLVILFFNKIAREFDYIGEIANEAKNILWITISCLCAQIIKFIENHPEQSIKNFENELSEQHKKTHLIVLKSIENLVRSFKKYSENDIYDYLPSVASIISGKKFDIKSINNNHLKQIQSQYKITKNYAETCIWIYNNTPSNRINFFLK